MYACIWAVFNILGRLFFRYRAHGVRHIPKTGGVLFAANHASYVDIPFLGCGIPRRVSFLGRANLFANPVINWMFKKIAWIPLKTNRIDRVALDEAVTRLKAGKCVVIFPEGTRTPDGRLQEGRPGIGLILAQAQCPVVPAYINGTYQVLPMGSFWLRLNPIQVFFGEPMMFPYSKEQEAKEYYHTVSSTVMTHIARLENGHQSKESHS
ncbi:MAG: 1-acyl-sn-glycerol-3-phosphate acyltransferase [Nitrospirales bacterium]|nr:1-acyl-sn-glycerol-3-phosphate acyltransferase [Nitrospira sp.]MDR4500415.1 1-acyl-sn-glycerol-3-phosphate acyltransferase [Nitrospirales bacterium]